MARKLTNEGATGRALAARSLPDRSATASLHLQGAEQARCNPGTLGEAVGKSELRPWEPLSQGKGQEEMDGGGRLNSSLQKPGA